MVYPWTPGRGSTTAERPTLPTRNTRRPPPLWPSRMPLAAAPGPTGAPTISLYGRRRFRPLKPWAGAAVVLALLSAPVVSYLRLKWIIDGSIVVRFLDFDSRLHYVHHDANSTLNIFDFIIYGRFYYVAKFKSLCLENLFDLLFLKLTHLKNHEKSLI